MSGTSNISTANQDPSDIFRNPAIIPDFSNNAYNAQLLKEVKLQVHEIFEPVAFQANLALGKEVGLVPKNGVNTSESISNRNHVVKSFPESEHQAMVEHDADERLEKARKEVATAIVDRRTGTFINDGKSLNKGFKKGEYDIDAAEQLSDNPLFKYEVAHRTRVAILAARREADLKAQNVNGKDRQNQIRTDVLEFNVGSKSLLSELNKAVKDERLKRSGFYKTSTRADHRLVLRDQRKTPYLRDSLMASYLQAKENGLKSWKSLDRTKSTKDRVSKKSAALAAFKTIGHGAKHFKKEMLPDIILTFKNAFVEVKQDAHEKFNNLDKNTKGRIPIKARILASAETIAHGAKVITKDVFKNTYESSKILFSEFKETGSEQWSSLDRSKKERVSKKAGVMAVSESVFYGVKLIGSEVLPVARDNFVDTYLRKSRQGYETWNKLDQTRNGRIAKRAGIVAVGGAIGFGVGLLGVEILPAAVIGAASRIGYTSFVRRGNVKADLLKAPDDQRLITRKITQLKRDGLRAISKNNDPRVIDNSDFLHNFIKETYIDPANALRKHRRIAFVIEAVLAAGGAAIGDLIAHAFSESSGTGTIGPIVTPHASHAVNPIDAGIHNAKDFTNPFSLLGKEMHKVFTLKHHVGNSNHSPSPNAPVNHAARHHTKIPKRTHKASTTKSKVPKFITLKNSHLKGLYPSNVYEKVEGVRKGYLDLVQAQNKAIAHHLIEKVTVSPTDYWLRLTNKGAKLIGERKGGSSATKAIINVVGRFGKIKIKVS
jgi:hypothetical protein